MVINKTIKNKNKNKNKNFNTTKKNYTFKEKQIICQKSANTYNQFENLLTVKNVSNNVKKSQGFEKYLIKAFHTPYAPSKITARSDYYTYINYGWISEQTEILKKKQKYYPQQDSFRMVQEKVYYELIDIVKEYTKTNHSKQSKEIKNIYDSFYKLDEKSAQKHVYSTIDMIDSFIKKDNLIDFLAHINKNEIVSWGSPLAWALSPDDKNSKIYRNTINAPMLTLYDYTIYIEDTADDQNTKKFKKTFKNRYFQFLKTMFHLCIGPNNGLNPQDVWDVEYDMLTAMGCSSVKNDSEEYYNVVTSTDSLKKYDFDWERFSSSLGYKQTPSFYICGSLNYLKCCMKMLSENENWKTTKWRTYYIYIYLRQIMRVHNKWRTMFFDFFGKFTRGLPVIFPQELYPIFALSLCFNNFLTNEYVERNKKQEHIDYVENMAKDLITVFKRIVSRNTWLSPKTKKYALLKLDHLHLIVGSPKILRPDPVLNYSPVDAWGNLIKISSWRVNEFLKLDGKPIVDIPTINWGDFKLSGTQAYVVNAYYTPTQNSIYIPLAYLQKPFIDLDERGIEYNLAHVGYTLGHEMSHSLDDMGSKYDYKGNLKNWWTKEDRVKFDAKIKNVIKQYETFAAYDGIKMDASISTGENLADISGLAICEEYLRDFQIKNNDITPISALSFEAFFVYIAIQARQKIYEKSIKAQLKINPHPMDKYRTNCPLARLKLFQSLYNIQKGDKMYWSSTDTIW